MKTSIILWIAAFVLTAASAIYQRVTGPTYPVSGTMLFGGHSIPYKFDRSHGGEDDHRVVLRVPDAAIKGVLLWKRYKTNDPWTVVPMTLASDTLSAALPHQPPAGKLSYRIMLERGNEQASVPEKDPVVIRFKGDVPTPVLIVHVGLMFVGMLFSTRGGLECLRKQPKLGPIANWSAAFLFVGGLMLGPLVQKYAFGAYWTGWPFGHDLTDNKTALIAFSWVFAAWAIRRNSNPRAWAIAAAVITLGVFLIPHSVLGSEIDYTNQPAQIQQAPPAN